jgi:hypothetical protein
MAPQEMKPCTTLFALRKVRDLDGTEYHAGMLNRKEETRNRIRITKHGVDTIMELPTDITAGIILKELTFLVFGRNGCSGSRTEWGHHFSIFEIDKE